MFIRRLILIITLSSLFISNSALAQNITTAQGQQSTSAAVTSSVSPDGTIRFTSPGEITGIRLEIYNATGQSVYDSGLRQGGIIDWKITDATQPMFDGSYVSIVTVKDLQGKLRQRLGALSVQAGQVALQTLRADGLSVEQSQALAANRQARKIEPSDNNDAIAILREGKERSVTITAHDGENGQVTSTKGSLTFRTGDTFSKQEKEQMRITPEGQVGIGTDKPEATLDVAGTIRARGGIRFEDGTVLTSAQLPVRSAQDNKTAALSNVSLTANAVGTGTTNKLAKWTDGASGTLGDSAITQSGNNIGIGTATPTARLHVVGTQGVFSAGSFQLDAPTLFSGWTSAYPAFELVNTNQTDNNVSLFQFSDAASGASHAGIGSVNTNHLNKFGDLFFYTKQADGYQIRMGIFGNNVGIGTVNPTNKLEVAGNIKVSGAGNGLVFADGSVLTTANPGGGSPSGSSIVTAINDAGTVGVVGDNRLSPNVAKLNAQNNWTGQNTFNGLSMNGTNIVNVANPVSATDATNKAYVDANFIKFVPGAEQLSVGDANGTAPMINLRGGSTCCSGPGGHTPAFFKVFQNGSFVATGNLGIGNSPMEGKGYRTSWHTYKGAFRSGYADNEWDDANVGFFSWAGGSNSTASGLYAFAFGDTNFAESTSSIVFGSGNQVKGAAGFSAGAGNRVCDTYGVALGNNAKSGGPYINGKCDPDSFNLRGLAAVAIGYNVTADQDHTTAMGKFASNNGFTGTFVWSDGSAQASADTFRNTANNEFALRATGGFRFRTNLGGTTGCNLPAGSGVFNCTSSRTTKENFSLVDGNDVLARLRKVPVSTWNYIAEGNQSRHLGPMAEDFYSAFQLGTSDKAIGIQDAVGVSLAAVKALDTRTSQLQLKAAEVDKLRAEVNELRSVNALMLERLAALEQNAQKKANAQKKKAQGRHR